MVTAIFTSIGAAGLGGLGFVVQQQVAAEEPPRDRLHPRLLLHLARRPRWLAGIASMVIGQIFGAVALSTGGLELVEPLLTTNLLFALAIAAVWRRQRLVRREWIGAVLVAGGLGGFVVAVGPTEGNIGAEWWGWALSMGLTVAVVGGLIVRSRRQSPVATARTVGAAAGVMFGLQDVLTRRVFEGFPHTMVSLLQQWPPYTLLVVGACGLLLAQSAFEAGPLPASLPPITFAEPLTGIAFGIGVYSEHLSLTAPALCAAVGCLAVAAWGVWLVAAAPTLTSQHSR